MRTDVGQLVLDRGIKLGHVLLVAGNQQRIADATALADQARCAQCPRCSSAATAPARQNRWTGRGDRSAPPSLRVPARRPSSRSPTSAPTRASSAPSAQTSPGPGMSSTSRCSPNSSSDTRTAPRSGYSVTDNLDRRQRAFVAVQIRRDGNDIVSAVCKIDTRAASSRPFRRHRLLRSQPQDPRPALRLPGARPPCRYGRSENRPPSARQPQGRRPPATPAPRRSAARDRKLRNAKTMRLHAAVLPSLTRRAGIERRACDRNARQVSLSWVTSTSVVDGIAIQLEHQLHDVGARCGYRGCPLARRQTARRARSQTRAR